jgi:hypothetical protein
MILLVVVVQGTLMIYVSTHEQTPFPVILKSGEVFSLPLHICEFYLGSSPLSLELGKVLIALPVAQITTKVYC